MRAVKLFVLTLTVHFIIVVVDSSVGQDHQDIVVSPLVGFEEFYLEARRSNNPKFDGSEFENEAEICKAITNSVYFFYGHGLDSVHPEMKHINETLFNEKPHYTQYEIFFDSNIVHDFAFTCKAWKRSPGALPPKSNSGWLPKPNTMVKYYVSRQYQLDWYRADEVENKPNFGIGRFVFVNNTDGRMIVLAMAEKPLSKILGVKLPVCHSHPRTDIAFGVSSNQLSICDWRAAMKVRLCSIMINGMFGVRYLPLSEPPCVDPNITITAPKSESFSNWAIECVVEEIEFHEHQKYYIFQSGNHDRMGFCVARYKYSKVECDNCVVLTKMRLSTPRPYRRFTYDYDDSL